MSQEGAPENVLRFIDDYIESVEHLEILLLLSAEPREWSAAEIFQKIQSSRASVEQRLQSLADAGLLIRNGACYRFDPREEELRRVVFDLAEAYRDWRVRVIEAIYNRKTDAVQSFADAFKFKRKE